MEGRRLIAQMVSAGMSQYLAQVQGISPRTEKLLSRRVVKFLWAGKSPLVNEETVYEPLVNRGRAVVDIKSRNKAINMMWLKAYLSFGPDRPLWAYVADALMAENTPPSEGSVDDRVKISPFLQSWKTRKTLRGETCPDIVSLFKTAAEFNVRPEGLAFSRSILREMPMWYHLAADPKLRKMNHGRTAECLKSKHKILLVGEAEDLADLAKENGHLETNECECRACMELENEKGCMHPHSCIARAKTMIGTLPNKWNPRARQPDDNMENTASQEETDTSPNLVKFNPLLATEGYVADIFRIFTTGPMNNRLYMAERHVNETEPLTFYVKGKNKTRKAPREQLIGAGIACEGISELNVGKVWSGIGQEQDGGTLLAIALALMAAGIHTPLTINIRSYKDLAVLTEDLREIEDKGFLGIKNAGLLRTVIARLRMHTSPIFFQDLKDFPSSKDEAAAGALAKAALQGGEIMVLPPIPTELHLTGAKLSRMTQATAYKTIKSNAKPPTRPRTRMMLDGAKRVIGKENKRIPSDDQIWSSLRDKDMSRLIRVFLWKSMHNAYKVGAYWNKPNMPPELQRRHKCEQDGTEDSL